MFAPPGLAPPLCGAFSFLKEKIMSKITRMIPDIRDLACRIENSISSGESSFTVHDVNLLRGLIVASIDEEKSVAGMKASIAEAIGIKRERNEQIV